MGYKGVINVSLECTQNKEHSGIGNDINQSFQ